MEDSLKRLKKARDKPLTTITVSGVSDDDKIRLQLALDVENFGKQVGTDIFYSQAPARLSPGIEHE